MASLDDETADILNDIFCLDLDWSFAGGTTFDLPALREFESLCQELAKKLSSSKLEAAIWFLSQARHIVRAGSTAEAVFEPLSLTLDQKERLRELITYPALEESFSILEEVTVRGHVLSTLLTGRDGDEVFNALLLAERDVLRRAGLNQRSAAIVSDRIEHHRRKITINIIESRSVLINRLGPSLGAMADMARIPVRNSARNNPIRPVTLRSTRNLSRAKEKVIGLATLWADALPLLTLGDWGIASVFSTAAGATVAALLPRGDETPPGDRL